MHLSFTIVRPNGVAGKTYSVEGDVVVFGRSEQSHVLLDDDYVSASHAQIKCVGQDFYLQDLNSTNGTLVNSKRINGLVQLQENTIIEFGVGGPKVRVFSFSPAAPNAHEQQSKKSQDLPANIAADATRTPAVSNGDANSQISILQKTAYFAAGCIALLLCVLASRYLFFPSQSSATSGNSDSLDVAKSTEVRERTAVDNTSNADSQNTSSAAMPEQGKAVLNENLSSKEPRQAEINYSRVAESVRDQAVWVGLRVRVDNQDLVMPYNAGWLLSDSRVITTAVTVIGLQSLQEEGAVVVYSHLLPESVGFVEVKSLGMHPQFSVAEPESSVSQSNNIGWLELAMPVPLPSGIMHVMADNDEWKRTFANEADCHSIQCGYLITSHDAVSPLKMPKYTWTRVAATESISGGSSLQILPMIRIQIPQSQLVSNGQLVVDSAGKILGTLSRINQNTVTMIPNDRIASLLISSMRITP